MRTLAVVGTVMFVGVLAVFFVNDPAERLRWYHTEHRNDPLFALEGTNPDKLRGAVQALSGQIYTSPEWLTEEERKSLRRGLYPMQFLNSLPQTETLRQQLLDDPTLYDAWRYHRSLVNTIEKYINDVETVTQELDKLPESELAFIAGYTTPAFVAEQLRHAQNDARDVLEKERQRFGCVWRTRCTLKYTDTMQQVVVQKSPGAISELPEPVQTIRTIILEYFMRYEERASEGVSGIPLSQSTVIRTPQSQCIPSFAPAYYLGRWTMSRTRNADKVLIVPLNDLFFNDLKVARGRYYETLAQAHIPYQYQGFHPYLCMDYAKEAGGVLSALYIQEKLRERPTFSTGEPSQTSLLLATLAIQERDIVESPVLDTELIGAFIQNVELALKSADDPEVVQRIGTNAAHLESLSSVWQGKSAWFDDVVSSFDDLWLAIESVARYQKTPLYAFFLTRGFMSSLFLLNNETVVRKPYSLLERHEPVPLSDFYTVTYHHDLAPQYTPEEMIEYMLESEQRVNETVH